MGGSAICFVSVLLHESAHLGAMLSLHMAPARIILSALGCRVVLNRGCHLSDWKQAIISLSGPAANWLVFLSTLILGFADSPLAMVNLALGLTHILPIEPLDGGFALRYILRSQFGEEKADSVSKGISVLFLLPLALLGFYILLRTQYNYSLLALSIYLMLYLVLGKDEAAP